MNERKKSNSHLAKKLEMNDLINKFVVVADDKTPLPISRLVFIVNTRLGFSEKSVMDRLEMLEANGHIILEGGFIKNVCVAKKEDPSEVQGGF